MHPTRTLGHHYATRPDSVTADLMVNSLDELTEHLTPTA